MMYELKSMRVTQFSGSPAVQKGERRKPFRDALTHNEELCFTFANDAFREISSVHL